jgi:pimeloyl-ACP methyl ester carboxylesterase
MDIYIEDLNAIIEEICDSKPSIAEHSLGGAIPKYVLEYGENIEKLILVSTGARLRVAPIIFDMIENKFVGIFIILNAFFHLIVSLYNFSSSLLILPSGNIKSELILLALPFYILHNSQSPLQ